MKVFWSWQSDTPGKTGRHFVRKCLLDAITIVKAAFDVEEPSERDARQAIELDQDRVGIAGNKTLADVIFDKIRAAAVFVADVTLTTELAVAKTDDNPDGIKKFINSNVAIEYGYAVGTLTDDATLLVMNLDYGPLTRLPFDLAHKIAPCRYKLASDATPAEIAKERKVLTKQFVNALELHIKRIAAVTSPPPAIPFQRTPATYSPAFFWKRGDVLARPGEPHPFRPSADDVAEYIFDEERAFYLRLMPTSSLPGSLNITKLTDAAQHAHVQLMEQMSSPHRGRNQYGALIFDPMGSRRSVVALCQLFRNGEIWNVSREFIGTGLGYLVIPVDTLEKNLAKGLSSSIDLAENRLGIEPPYDAEIGAVGLKDVRISLPQPPGRYVTNVSGPIFDDQIIYPFRPDKIDPASVALAVHAFLRRLYDLADVEYQVPAA